jgi:hypothetical protein
LRAESGDRPRLLVVGGASLDIIHVKGQPTPTPGGAGLYTALAAARAGADVTMLAPVPHPMPRELAPALDRIRWIGPEVPLDGLPRFEIAYDDSGAVTLFREHLGAEPDMTPALLDAIDDLPGCAYCVPFLDARLQQAFIRALAARGCLTVASTYGKAVRNETHVVRTTQALADLFFCNDDEAALLFGDHDTPPPAGHLRYVTRGCGATVHQGSHRTDIDGTAGRARPHRCRRHVLRHHHCAAAAGDHPVVAAHSAMLPPPRWSPWSAPPHCGRQRRHRPRPPTPAFESTMPRCTAWERSSAVCPTSTGSPSSATCSLQSAIRQRWSGSVQPPCSSADSGSPRAARTRGR